MDRIVAKVAAAWKRLSRKERNWLVSESSISPDANRRLRCKIVRNLARGEPPTRIATILGCSRSQVYRMAERFLVNGLPGLVDRRAENGTVKVTEEYEWAVLVMVAKSPLEYGYQRPTWTQELLIMVANEQVGVSVSTSIMSRLLSRHGARKGRPKPIVLCPWPERKTKQRLRWIRRLRRTLPPNEVLLYVDEVDIHLNPKIGDDWMLSGQQKTVLTPGQNKKYYLAGALNAMTGRLAWVEGPRKTSALFIQLVDHLVKRCYFSAKRIHLVLDNYRIHTSRAVQLAAMRWGDRVVFHFLPPYCPDDNLIERLWKDLHDNVTRNHRCSSLDELLDRVRDYLEIRQRTGTHHYATAA